MIYRKGCRIKDFVKFNPTRKITKGKPVPYVDMSSISEKNRDIKEIVYRLFEGSGSRFRNEDTLLARLNPSPHSTNSENIKSALVNGLQMDGWGSTEFIVMSPRTVSDTDFIYYITQFPEFRKYVMKNMSGTTRQRVSWKRISEFEFNFPGKGYRAKSGFALKMFDDLIQNNIEQNKILEQIIQMVFRSWFVNFDPVHVKFTREFENSEIGQIPKGWFLEGLNSNISFLNGLALQKLPPRGDGNDLPVLKIAQLKKGAVNSDKCSSKGIDEKYIVEDGDLIFSWSASLVVKIWCGGKAALNQHLFKVTSNKYPTWFQWQWCNFHLEKFQAIAKYKATTMGHIQRKHLAEAKILIPTHKEMAVFNQFFEPLVAKIVLNNSEIKKMEKLKGILLPKLMTEEIDLSSITLDNDPKQNLS